MKPVRPSCHPGLRKETHEIPRKVRALSTPRILFALSGRLPHDLRPEPDDYMTNLKTGGALGQELKIRLQMARELVDMHAHDDRPGAAPRSDLSVVAAILASGDDPAADAWYYGRTHTERVPLWYVECRKRMWPWCGCLPLGFQFKEGATLAMHALARAGLGTDEALHQRIRVERDWEGVKRIMLDAQCNA